MIAFDAVSTSTKVYASNGTLIAPPSCIKSVHNVYNPHHDFVAREEGGLEVQAIGSKKIAQQRRDFARFLKKVPGLLFSGSLVLHKMSFPVELNEAASALEVLSYQLRSHHLLSEAAKHSDAIERMKFVAAFAVSSMQQCCRIEKPLNPVLGETFQGEYSNGASLAMEQLSHHPPISAISLYGPQNEFLLFGETEVTLKFGSNCNSIACHRKGTWHTIFGAHEIRFRLPSLLRSGGIVAGKRHIEFIGNILVEDISNSLSLKISLGETLKRSTLSKLFRSPTQPSHVMNGELKTVESSYVFELFERQECLVEEGAASTIHSVAHGDWVHNLCFDNQSYWHSNTNKDHELHCPRVLLPSDSRLREDSLHIRCGDIQKAQNAKTQLEELQRSDRKHRQMST